MRVSAFAVIGIAMGVLPRPWDSWFIALIVFAGLTLLVVRRINRCDDPRHAKPPRPSLIDVDAALATKRQPGKKCTTIGGCEALSANDGTGNMDDVLDNAVSVGRVVRPIPPAFIACPSRR